jgi:hypothetical protein
MPSGRLVYAASATSAQPTGGSSSINGVGSRTSAACSACAAAKAAASCTARRFLAAHTPTRRELSRVVDIATRLRRGEDLFEAE